MPGCEIYLEIGAKRTFACAVDWPGWCRSGPDEMGSLHALLDYGPRYAAVVRSARLGFRTPSGIDDFRVVERLNGNATTDFGAPGVVPSFDRAKATSTDYARLEKIMRAAWRALDAARQEAKGKALRKGPRGGGRELPAILSHVVEADRAYLTALGWKPGPPSDQAHTLQQTRKAILDGLRASARGEIAETGPRGGKRWPVRYFVRRAAWHAIAHAWEIERRITG